MPEKMNKIIAWGQYMHWADLQYSQYTNLKDNELDSVAIGTISHCMAAQYVVIEGWMELNFSDKAINCLLEKYPDFIDIFRRCRNAVYHYQKNILDKRISAVSKDPEIIYWLLALKHEFERFLYFYPFVEFGLNTASIELSQKYFDCIGWKPECNIHVQKLETFLLCKDYIDDNANNKFERNKENNLLILETIKSLEKINANFMSQKLSRLK